MNGQPVTLTADLTTDTPSADTPLPTKVVTISVGSGSTVQSCSDTSDADGNVSCTVPTLDQPSGTEPMTAPFTGDSYDTSSSATSTMSVTEPTTLTVNSTTGDYADSTMVSGTLTDTITNAPLSGEPVVLTLDGHETCTATTDSTGTASCSVTPSEPAGTYTLAGSFAGDANAPLQLISSKGSANFVVTLEESSLTYTGAPTAQNGQPYVTSGVLTSDGSTPIVGRTVSFTLGTGSAAQTCSGITDRSGAAACTIASVTQPPGPVPATASFTSDGYYRPTSAIVHRQSAGRDPTHTHPDDGDLWHAHTDLHDAGEHLYQPPVAHEPVTLTVNDDPVVFGYDERQRASPPVPSPPPNLRAPTR